MLIDDNSDNINLKEFSTPAMQKFEFLNQYSKLVDGNRLGKGSFGEVFRCEHIRVSKIFSFFLA